MPVLQIRITEEVLAEMKKEAIEMGRPVSVWARAVLLQQIKELHPSKASVRAAAIEKMQELAPKVAAIRKPQPFSMVEPSEEERREARKSWECIKCWRDRRQDDEALTGPGLCLFCRGEGVKFKEEGNVISVDDGGVRPVRDMFSSVPSKPKPGTTP